MKSAEVMKCLELLEGIDCSYIELSLGWTDDSNMCRKGLVINSCPPIVITKLVAAGYSLDLTKHGMIVNKY